jgi:hypothetical protein
MFFDGAHGWNIDIDAEPIGSISVLHLGEWKGLGQAGLHDARCWVLRDRNDQGNLVGLFLWTFFGQQSYSSESLVVRGTARTLRTTQWTRAS